MAPAGDGAGAAAVDAHRHAAGAAGAHREVQAQAVVERAAEREHVEGGAHRADRARGVGAERVVIAERDVVEVEVTGGGPNGRFNIDYELAGSIRRVAGRCSYRTAPRRSGSGLDHRRPGS